MALLNSDRLIMPGEGITEDSSFSKNKKILYDGHEVQILNDFYTDYGKKTEQVSFKNFQSSFCSAFIVKSLFYLYGRIPQSSHRCHCRCRPGLPSYVLAHEP